VATRAVLGGPVPLGSVAEPAGQAYSAGLPETDPSRVLDVVAIGSALVDVVVRASDDQLAELELPKGSMSLIDRARAEDIGARVRSSMEISGGSAANTMAGVACLGGAAGFVGKVVDDRLGEVFSREIRASGVTFEPIVDRAGDEAVGTGRCLVLVTEDADRTMATYLGAATTMEPADVPLDLVARAQVVYLEGYLWDLPPAIEAMRHAIAVGHDAGASVALSLSDPFCVQRHQREFLDLLRDEIDVLFGNEEELVALFGVGGFEAALNAAEETGLLVAATRGAKGSVVTTPHGALAVEPAPVEQVIDTTGAGDLYAAGFLYGLTHGEGPARCAALGGVCASEIISHFGARPEADLRELAKVAGLL
jgi:sugar/nucleoside kinase (ribokinase family)